MAKKKTKRSREKYPNLKPELNLKTRYESVDQDYIDKLSPKEKEWLNKFMGEYVGASFSKNNEDNIQKSAAHKKESYDRNNARNRCVLTRAKATGVVDYLDDLKPDRRLTHPQESMDNAILYKQLLGKFDKSSDDGENK